MKRQLAVPWLSLLVVGVISLLFNLQALYHPTKAGNPVFLLIVGTLIIVPAIGLVLGRGNRRLRVPGWLFLGAVVVFSVLFGYRAFVESNIIFGGFVALWTVIMVVVYGATYRIHRERLNHTN